MDILGSINAIPVGIAIAAIAVLGFVVFFNNPKSITNRTFLWFALIAILWNGSNYLAYQFTSLTLVTWMLRFVLFFAVWYCFFLFRFFYVYPESVIGFSPKLKKYLIPWVVFASIVVLTPLGINRIYKLPSVQTGPEDVVGPGMAVFGLTVVSLILCGIIVFIKKRKKADDQTPYNYILIGTIITFSLYILFNFVYPVFLNNIDLIPLGAIFTFPFIGYTSYVIMKHRFLGVKVVSTEILVFSLSIVVLLELVNSQGIQIAIRSIEFLLILGVGVLLIRSVVREVKQREQLEKLDKELEAANEQLKQLDKARAEFISIASHQLRTPPATIKWYLAAITGGDFGPVNERVKKAVVTAETTNNSLISLIDDLLNASRIERGKMEFVYEPTDMLKITQITVDQLTPLALQRKQKIVYHPPKEEIPLVNADREKLRQVINNLIDNAIKYTPVDGVITVELSKTAKDVMVRVKDTGRGIKPTELENIFKKYDRGGKKMDSQGLGLGLYVARVVMQQHQGKIWAESEGEGKGSTFVISIPLNTTLKNSTLDLVKEQK
jgi:signal transduction histidine kinase